MKKLKSNSSKIVLLVLFLSSLLSPALAEYKAFYTAHYEYLVPESWSFSEKDGGYIHYSEEGINAEIGGFSVREVSTKNTEYQNSDPYEFIQYIADSKANKNGNEASTNHVTLNRIFINGMKTVYCVESSIKDNRSSHILRLFVLNNDNILEFMYIRPNWDAKKITEQGLIFANNIRYHYEILKVGSNGPEVAKLKQRMFELGYFKNNTVNESFTSNTAEYVKKFEIMNGLPADGIADLGMQELFFSDSAKRADGTMAVPANGIALNQSIPLVKQAPMPTEIPVKVSGDYVVTKEFRWEQYKSYHNDLVIRNTSGQDSAIEVTMYFKDRDGNIIGVENNEKRACEDGCETFWEFSNDEEFHSVEYEVTLSNEDFFTCVQSDIELKVSKTKSKAIISVKNTGDKPIQFTQYNALFLDINGNVVGSSFGLLGDNDFEIKPGKTEMEEANSWGEAFSEVIVYATGYAD